MAFWLYRKVGDTYRRVRPVVITGKDGLMGRFLRGLQAKDTPCQWQLPVSELARLESAAEGGGEPALVLDMLPEDFTRASLYLVTDIRGSSEDDETDLVMSCELLFQGPVPGPMQDFKAQLTIPLLTDTRRMVEAMRITGGLKTGTYRWARPKMDIGAAICPAKAPSPALA
ncbi:MAG: hypothetical protein Q7P63_07270 [Verrucomicrobiota bacterium JB022]|nr:hypothetical protein [Verrucomicrobiota bacterium JB022]